MDDVFVWVFYLIAPAIHYFVNNSGNKNTNSLIALCVGMALDLILEKVYLLCEGVFSDSGKYLLNHSPFAVLFVFFVGMNIYYHSRKVISLVLLAIIGSIYNNERLVVSALFGMLINGTIGIQLNCGGKIAKLLKLFDEYSFLIYLGHTTVMYIFSRIQEQLGFGKVKLAIIDLAGCFIFIPIIHELIEKKSSERLKSR